jgi:MipA family protein
MPNQTLHSFTSLVASPYVRGLAAACLVLASCNAQAQAKDGSGSSKDDGLVVTVGAGYGTDGLGGSTTKPKAFPIIDLSYTSGRFTAGLSNFEYRILNSDEFTLSTGVGYEFGRKEKDSVRLKGMGDIKGGAVVGLNASSQLLDGFITLNAGTRFATRRTNGYTGTLGTTFAYPLAGRNLIGSLNLAANFADKKHMQTYYGVTALQAARSGYKPFQAKAGLYETSVALGLNYTINKQWSANAFLGANRREGSAADSPIFTRKVEPNGGLAFSYRF